MSTNTGGGRLKFKKLNKYLHPWKINNDTGKTNPVKMCLLPKMVIFFHCHRSFRGVPNTWPQTSGQIFLPKPEQAIWKRISLPSPPFGGFPTRGLVAMKFAQQTSLHLVE